MNHTEIARTRDGVSEIVAATEGRFPQLKDALTVLDGLVALTRVAHAPAPAPGQNLTHDGKGKGKGKVDRATAQALLAAYIGKLNTSGTRRFTNLQAVAFTGLPPSASASHIKTLERRGEIFLVRPGNRRKESPLWEIKKAGHASPMFQATAHS